PVPSIVLWYCLHPVMSTSAGSCRIHARISPIGTSFDVRQALGSARDSKRKCSSGSIIRCRPQTSMMTLGNGVANMQPDSHSSVLGCIASFKEFGRGFRRKADSNVSHRKAYLITFIGFGSDE